jgi:type IV fimbrial biogenesis protein FimT
MSIVGGVAKWRRQGVSLTEGLVVAALSSTLAAAAVANFSQWRAQVAVEQAAAAFEADVHQARSLAIARGEAVRMAFEEAPDGQCWMLHSGARGSCRCEAGGSPVCEGASVVFHVAHWPQSQPVRVAANVRSLAFDATHGTVSPTATVRFTGANGRALNQVVGIMGRVRSCAPNGPWSGYKAC